MPGRMTAAFAVGQMEGPVLSSMLSGKSEGFDGPFIALAVGAAALPASAVWLARSLLALLGTLVDRNPDMIEQGHTQPWADRLPMPSAESMTDAQRAAAQSLIDRSPHGRVSPFIPLLQSAATDGTHRHTRRNLRRQRDH
jgi:hypothetical protein